MGDPLAEAPTFATADHPLHMYITVKALRKAVENDDQPEIFPQGPREA